MNAQYFPSFPVITQHISLHGGSLHAFTSGVHIISVCLRVALQLYMPTGRERGDGSNQENRNGFGVMVVRKYSVLWIEHVDNV
jgi:hypothetical protein